MTAVRPYHKDNNNIGTWHAGELQYAYGNLDMELGVFDESDEAVSDLMVSYWLNFAKYGDPNGAGLPEWTMYNDSKDQLMVFDTQSGMQDNPYIKIFEVIDGYQQTLK